MPGESPCAVRWSMGVVFGMVKALVTGELLAKKTSSPLGSAGGGEGGLSS